VDALGHGKTVLGTILASRVPAALDYASKFLEPGHFTDPVQRNLWIMCQRYMDQAGHVLTRQAVEDGLRSAPPGQALMYLQYFDSLLASCVPQDPGGVAAFRWGVLQLRELAAERTTGEAITQGMEILRRGLKEGRQEYQGHTDARSWLLAKFAAIERQLHQADAPEGDMRHETGEILSTYGDAKAQRLLGTTGLIATGIAELDALFGGGLARGELDLVVGWTSAGKTSFVVQLAWYAAAVQGRNVVFLTTETLRPQIRVKILARHSRLERFGLRQGLNSRDIKAGTLTPAAEAKLQEVAADFAQISGRLHIAQVPKGATVSVIDSRLAGLSRNWAADLVVLDYAQLLRPEVQRRSLWEETSTIIKDLKDVAVGYMDGRGVPLISPWQVSREARVQARQRGFYILSDLAATQDAANTADGVMSLLEPDDFTGGRDVMLDLSLLKSRDGEAKFGAGNSIKLRADYATSCFEAQASGASIGAGLMNYSPAEEFGAALA
jgi:replicative DNA helicase